MSETNVQLFPGVFRTTQGGSNPDFFLHSAGRVGIGNDAPGDVAPPGSSSGTTFKLNVTGHAHVSGTMQANKYYGDGSTLSGVAAVVGGYWDLDQANNNIKYDVGNVGIGGAAGTEELTVHGSSHMISSIATGNVGMIAGNSDRQWRVGIRGDTNDDFAIQDDTAGQMRLRIDSSGNVGIDGDPGTEKLTVHGDLNLNGGNLKLNGQTAVFSNWTSGTNSIYRSVGNVGIGTTNADKAKLQINNTLALLNPSYKTPGDDDQLAGKIEFYLGGSAHELTTPVAGIEGYDKYAGGSFAGALALKVHGGEKMRILSNGNVGVGTMVPNSPLEIYTDDGALSQGGGLRIHHITGSPKIEFVRGGHNRSPNTNVFGASNYTDWRFGCAGPNISFSRKSTGDSGAGVGNEAIVMQIQYNGPILSQLDSGWTLNNTNSGNGDDNSAVSLYRDYNSWISIFKHTWLDGGGGWGTFWAGNSGAAYSRISTDNNPNEYVLVGGGAKRFTFDLDSGGHAYFDGTLSQNSYDYAEYFEWEDGNPDNEDRRGYSVVLCENGKIKKAISDDEPTDIFGIVSGTSGVIGDSACYDWQGKYEVDEWGTIVTDEVYQLTWSDEDNKNHTYDEDRVPEGVTVPDDVSRRLHNRKRIRPEYDASHVYIPRDKRKEWCPVGLLGKVRLRDGCPTNPNWRYMKTIAGKQLWLIR